MSTSLNNHKFSSSSTLSVTHQLHSEVRLLCLAITNSISWFAGDQHKWKLNCDHSAQICVEKNADDRNHRTCAAEKTNPVTQQHPINTDIW